MIRNMRIATLFFILLILFLNCKQTPQASVIQKREEQQKAEPPSSAEKPDTARFEEYIKTRTKLMQMYKSVLLPDARFVDSTEEDVTELETSDWLDSRA